MQTVLLCTYQFRLHMALWQYQSCSNLHFDARQLAVRKVMKQMMQFGLCCDSDPFCDILSCFRLLMVVLRQTQIALTECNGPPQTGMPPPLTPPALHVHQAHTGLPPLRRTPPGLPAPRPPPGQWTTLCLALAPVLQMEGWCIMSLY